MCDSYNRQYGRDYRYVMPTNLYGPGDNYQPENSHVVPALIRRFHEAKINKQDEVVVWGSGLPKLEFLYVDDMAEASLFVHDLEDDVFAKHVKSTHLNVNIGTGDEISIKELAEIIKRVIGFKGKVVYNIKMSDGTMRKLLDSSKINILSWKPKIALEEGIMSAYSEFIPRSDLHYLALGQPLLINSSNSVKKS